MIFYFSGTGNSEGIARLLAKDLSDQAINIIGADPKAYRFSETDSIGFVFPVYAYVAPAAMLSFASAIHPGKAYTYAVPTFSNCAGCTLEHFSERIHLDGGFGIKMPDNMPVFNKIVETRETAVEKLRAASARYEAVREKIAAKEKGFDIWKGDHAEDNTWKQGVQYLKENPFKTAAYHITEEKCIGCGLCAGICPASAIEMTAEKRPVWRKAECYMCMACLNKCPTEAIEYGEYSKGQYRYRFRGFDLDAY